MATRTYIQKASPYCSINSTCFVASVKYNELANEILVPVYKPDSIDIPSKEDEVIRLIEGTWSTSYDKPNEFYTFNASSKDVGQTIDGLKRIFDKHGQNVDTESI